MRLNQIPTKLALAGFSFFLFAQKTYADITIPLREELVGGQGEGELVVPQGELALIVYLGQAMQWVFGVAFGICIIWVMWGGVKFMSSGNNAGARQEAIENMKWAIGGLVIVIFSGTILRILNSLFFK